MAPPESRKIQVKSSFWLVYVVSGVAMLLAATGSVAARPTSGIGWMMVGVLYAGGASLLAQARAAFKAGVTVSDKGLDWLGRRGFVRYHADWDDIDGFSLTNGPRVLPCVESKEHGPLPLIAYGMTATRSKALIDELEEERKRRASRPAPSGPKPKASGTVRPPKRKKR